MKKILIVDDEFEIVELLKVYFKSSGFKVYQAYDGQMALNIIENNSVDVMVVDVMMPKIDGIQFVKKIRENSNIPIMFLSAKSEDMDKIYGLGVGADDYMSKPFNPLEVIARIQALMRRCYEFDSESKNNKKQKSLNIGSLCINEESCEVYKNDEKIDMTSVEYKLLLFLMKNPNRVFTKQQLYQNVWEEDYLENKNIIMVYISKIREKIEKDSKEPKYLKTIRGLGYRFEKKD